MNRIKRIAPIVELAETKEKQAVQAYGMKQQKLEEARKALNSLRSFRENYSALFNQSGTKGIGMRQLHEYRAFLAKINVAIAEQEKTVATAETELEAARLAWETAHGHTLGMHKVLDKLQAEQSRKEQKREQAEQDDRASRRGAGLKSLLTVFI
ncbi:flagellar export protein FliJ [Methyloterricola oryzae]|uniref:flagellar export protein FliJ n=1 Tax=Methyloterricola oryzae TaxID=1495050 RepID=UPI0005EB9E5B|nr:flagellar export protein FliJ [Methyloterricola oryzae]